MKRFFTSSSTLWSCLVVMAMMMSAQSARAEYVKLTALSGTGGTGGEGYAKLVDTKVDTKMGHSYDPGNSKPAWIVVKAEKAVVPEHYFLVTGSDTGSYKDRNWKKWNIYGGNFESDAAAVRGDVENPAAGGWTLIDSQSDAQLPQANMESAVFDFSEEPTTAYQYYWIEILESVNGGDVWLQMGEWGLGTYGEFQNYLKALNDQSTTTDQPIKYSFLSGSPAGNSGEGVGNLIDGNTTNKWCTGFTNRNEGETANGAYIVFKASRSIAPTYYYMITGNDTKNSPGRNWKQWRIYGMNTDNEAVVTRESDRWVLIDTKQNVQAGTGLNELPAANYAQGTFALSENNTTAYRYFKIEIDQCVKDGLMQMSEFAFGDEYTIAIDRNSLLEATAKRYNSEDFAEKALYDQMEQLVASINVASDPMVLGELTSSVDALVKKIDESKKKYVDLVSTYNAAVNQMADDNVKESALAYVNGWISETDVIAPNEEYPCGNYAYIKANRQLTGEEASAEAKRFTGYLQANVKKVDDPIGEVGYVYIDGTQDNWKDTESPRELIDGNSGINNETPSTKWGCGTDEDRFIIFKANKPIKPTYYGLVTGGDTGIYTDRNWKSWKIWAANFDQPLEELDATDPDEWAQKSAELRKSPNWVLIDEKNDVGTDVLKTTSLFESYINLSIGCDKPYEYFMIEVYHQGGMQMNEFCFYNMGDLVKYRDTFIQDFAEYDPEENPAYKGYTDAYKAKYEEMCNASYAPDLMKFKNELKDLQDKIANSVDKYIELESWFDELTTAGPASDELQEWFDGYTTQNIAPNSKYINGTFQYIMKNLTLDDDAIGKASSTYYEEVDGEKKLRYINPSGEIGYLQSMINAANDGLYIPLGGNTVGEWGDGHYSHLIDGSDVNDTEKDPTTGEDVTVNATKWGGAADEDGNTYIIFRTPAKTNPFFYTLTTGNDTGVYQDRNWGTWYIYGANFEGDAEATKDAEGWVLIDSKENVGKDRLHPVNAEPSYFGFSTETTEEYTYYKVVVTKAFKNSSIQMNELHFGTPEEFDEIKSKYQNAAKDFNTTDIKAEKSLIDKYDNSVDAIDECANMEALFRVNYLLETLRDSITASAAAYEKYQAAVKNVKDYLEENDLEDSDAKTTLDSYLNEVVEPSETFPFGSKEYIVENHLLADSVVLAEIEFMDSLKVAAIAAGYGPGMDISDLIVNRTFAKAGDMLKDENDKNIGRKADGWNGYIYRTASDDKGKLFAAEFCNEVSKFDVNQTISNLKNGYYKVTLNAGFRAQGDLKSYNYSALAYANDVKAYVPVVREEFGDEDTKWAGSIADKPFYVCDRDGVTGSAEVDSVVIGYCIWGCEGSAHAFAQGRYAITLVAQVTDGNLTVGVKNDGTVNGSDWLAAGNFGLTYLGEQSPAEEIAEVAQYNAARANTMTNVDMNMYQPADASNPQAFKLAPDFSASQKEALANVANSTTIEQLVADANLFEQINATKAAYYQLSYYNYVISDKWDEFSDACDIFNDYSDVIKNLTDGAYEDAEAATKALEAYLAKYPDYLNISGTRVVNGELEKIKEEPFNFKLTATSEKSVTAHFNATMYDELKDNETILEFEYKSATPLSDVKVQNLNSQNVTELPLGTLEAVPEFTKVSVIVKDLDVKNAKEMSLKFNVGNGGVVYIRHMIFVENPSKKGDANGDGEINGMDIIAVYNMMLGNTDKTAAGDVNGDGEVNGMDVIAVYNIMLGN